MCVVLIYIINFGGMANENNDILIVIKMTILVIGISSLSTVSIKVYIRAYFIIHLQWYTYRITILDVIINRKCYFVSSYITNIDWSTVNCLFNLLPYNSFYWYFPLIFVVLFDVKRWIKLSNHGNDAIFIKYCWMDMSKDL